MNDAASFRLLANYEATLDIAHRNLTIARALATGYRSGVRPPDVVLEAYLTRFDADDAHIAELRMKLNELKSGLRADTAR